ncbi:hypothetical protein R1flu_023016 [Riccia fluitans]|uniref:Uncharacterized protein n=1 Tax=Riccia fluitans TaxID=41844 RepID=A0ABD1XRD1_9MARC
MATLARNTSSVRSTSSSTASNSSLKENRPAWYGGCSPRRPSSLLRTNTGRPSVDNREMGIPKQGGASKVERPAVKKNPSPLRSVATAAAAGKNLRPASPRIIKPSSPRLRPASPRVTAPSVVNEDPKAETSIAAATKGKVTKPPVKNETPPPSRPKKPASSFVTPTSKGTRKPLATIGTPTNQGPEKRIRTLEETPTRKVKERPSISGFSQDAANKGTTKAQPFSAWTVSTGKTRRGSTPGKGTTPNRAPVKSMFLSPQASRKNNTVVKKEPLRKSAENHGIWVGQVPSRKRAAEKRENSDAGMPPPAQPTYSPEIPKRGSRELSGEGSRGGYFGAGPMVAPEGCGGFVRDRRKCKPRGTLVVDEALSVDSDSSGALETSIQMPLPAVASVEWMDRIGNSSTTSFRQYSNEMNQSRGGSAIYFGEEFRPNVKQARISGGDKNQQQVRQSRQSVDEYHQVKSSSQDLYGDSFYHHLTQARSSGGEGQTEVTHQSDQSESGFYRPRSSQEVFGEGFYQQLKYSRSSGGEAYKQVRHSRQKSGDGFYQVVRSSQVFLQQLRQSQLSSKECTNQFSTNLSHSTQFEDIPLHDSLNSEGMTQNSVFEDGIIKNSLYTERGIVGKSEQNGFPESAGYGDVTINWRDGLPDSEASSAKQSPDEFVAGSVSFGTSWVPPAQERRMSGCSKTWVAPDSTWYGFSPMTPEFQRTAQVPDSGSKLIDALVAAGSVRRRIITDQSSSYEKADLLNKSLIQSFQALNVDDNRSSQSRTSHSRSSHSRSSRGSQEAGALSFSFATRRSYANIAELEEAEQNPETPDTYMCQTASPIEPLRGDDAICEGPSPQDMMCQTGSSVLRGSVNCEAASPLLSDDVICQTASPLNEVGSAPTPLMVEDTDSRWDDSSEGEDGVEYASPVAGDYLSSARAPSRSDSPGRSMMDVAECNRGVRASRRASMSKTLEELMRHNLHL